MRNGIYKKYIALLAVLIAFLLTGCSAAGSIREDSVHEALPVIDPNAGVANDTDTAILEPQEFNADVAAQPEKVVSNVLEYLLGGEYEKAYALLADTAEGIEKPEFNDFKDKLSVCCKLTDYKILGSENNGGVAVTVSLTLLDGTGAEQTAVCELTVVQENGVYRLNCASLLAGLEGAV